ncbi:probable serine/threonine-protein kinase WNK4 [Impatiens glandulifera]|uniref:probable serine/threonine-protein kinase WNK4 n=1 Tax=Impatiens glandulifera TaxID=253017 RepID=UPI001FB1616E|nr:probable serine/threonine-protein kinase WNK4 [Impatiens glandulifera]
MSPANVAASYVETDPSGRYGRLKTVVGKGAMKTVYKAFDSVLGIEVAWYQVKLNHVFQSHEELTRLYSEVHILQSLKHKSLIKFYTSWIVPDQYTLNFITELFTSGTLIQYRKRYEQVDMRVIKNWARQILQGLAYLHTRETPVIHGDLKCDNIFVNGHHGEVKIGDFGLATFHRESHHKQSILGTPEFMAPEIYAEKYNELVDIYSFGMCMIEMLTLENPYSECSHSIILTMNAQIYKKVTTGNLPKAFYRIGNEDARQFVGKCLAVSSNRPSAVNLLNDPFLAMNDQEMDAFNCITNVSSSVTNETGQDILIPFQLVSVRHGEMTITVTGTMNHTDGSIELKARIVYNDRPAINAFFMFDIKSDIAINVAVEMVEKLKITDWRPEEIAHKIDDEISALVPGWKDYDHHHD